jgi:hypothetical protein
MRNGRHWETHSVTTRTDPRRQAAAMTPELCMEETCPPVKRSGRVFGATPGRAARGPNPSSSADAAKPLSAPAFVHRTMRFKHRRAAWNASLGDSSAVGNRSPDRVAAVVWRHRVSASGLDSDQK